MNQALLERYEVELQRLLDDGRKLAAASPRAGTLTQLYDAPDPFVTQMVQAFAYTLARLSMKLDAERQHVPSSVLQLLYPSATRPVPARTIVQFKWVEGQQVPAEGRRIATGTVLRPEDDPGGMSIGEFRTANECVLPPVRFARAQVQPPSEGDKSLRRLRLELEPAQAGQRLCDLRMPLPVSLDGKRHPDRAAEFGLRLFLGHDESNRSLYRALTQKPVTAELTIPGEATVRLNKGHNAVCPVGFDIGQSLLPPDPRQNEAMRLLAEYAVMREKFLFVDLVGLEPRLFKNATERATLDLLLDPDAAALIEGMNLAPRLHLGCVPAVNLESLVLDAVALHRTAHEISFTLRTPDASMLDALEIFDLEDVRATIGGETAVTYLELFSPLPTGLTVARDRAGHWCLRRSRRQEPAEGDDVWLSLVEFDAERTLQPGLSLNVSALCFRRDASVFGAGDSGFKSMHGDVEINAITKVHGPVWPNLAPDSVLRLIELLSCGAGLFHGSGDALTGLVRLLSIQGALYPVDEALTKLLDGSFIREVQVKPTAAALPGGIARGTELTMSVQAPGPSLHEVYLLVRVLDFALSAFCAAGGFTKLRPIYVDRGRTKELAECPPRSGKVALV